MIKPKNMTLRNGLLAGFILLVSFGSFAQQDSVFSFSLKQAQDYAIEHYFATKNAKLDIKAAEKKIWETTAIGLPQISGEASYQRILGEIPEFSFSMGDMLGPVFDYQFNALAQLGHPPTQDVLDALAPEETEEEDNGIMPRNSITYGITVSQLVFSGEYIVGLQAAKVYRAISEQSYEKSARDMKENIASSYYGLLILEKNVSLIEKTLENLKESAEQTNQFFKQGMIEDSEVDQLALTVKRTENSLNTIKRQLIALKKLFNYQLGLNATDEVKLTDDIDELIAADVIYRVDYQFNIDDNIDYRLLSTQEKLQKLNMNREKSTLLPSVSAFYKYSDKTEKGAIDFTIKHMVGVNLAVPIASSGMRLAKISQARIELDKAQNMKAQEAQRLIIMAEQAKYDYTSALEKYLNEKENFELSERVFNKASARHKQGMISALDLTMINNQFLQAQLTYASAVQELLNAKVKLDKAYNKL
jgi:outer membrane protein TolC